MHTWGDEKVDWKGIGDAADYIGHKLRRWGRINVTTTKEKWGRVCVYCNFGWSQLFSITHPGYVYSRYPNWLWHLDCIYFSRVVRRLNWLIVREQKWWYRVIYTRAIHKWPHLVKEILYGADYPEELIALYIATKTPWNWSGDVPKGCIPPVPTPDDNEVEDDKA